MGNRWQGGDGGFLIVECRCYKNSKQNQEKVGALAYRIQDTGADGGIIVSPMGLQEGATRVANANNVVSVTLNANCTTSDYIMRFLDKAFVGFSEHLDFKVSLMTEKFDVDGNLVERVTYNE